VASVNTRILETPKFVLVRRRRLRVFDVPPLPRQIKRCTSLCSLCLCGENRKGTLTNDYIGYIVQEFQKIFPDNLGVL
jgi:hypothetical protein